MALAPGTKLGPYEIQTAIGAGGMGEVYKARDSRLERIVAIKVLPTHLSANPELRARFEREAKAISGLQHPNICVLYDVGLQEGIDFLVMEYLEGETLYARLARKPLTTDETLKIATDVANALDKAHRSGIIHRDLKPGNVMLTKGGAKLMDFGLAKPQTFGSGPSSNVPGISSMATMAATIADLASPVTVAGTLIGTVQYMSPEQIQGKEADARSDIFAFGAMLYEMLTGHRAFQGKSQLSLASAILEREPEPIATLQPLTPPALEQIVRTCLAKDPDDRFQSAHDLKLQLQWIASANTSQLGAPAIVSSKRKKKITTLTAALAVGWLIAVIAIGLLLLYSSRLNTAQLPIHASVQQPAGFEFTPILAGAPAVSPDGRSVLFTVLRKGQVKNGASFQPSENLVFLMNMGTGEAAPVPGIVGGTFPFWSPDGKYIGFFSEGKLKKVPATGGPAQTLCDAPEGRGGSWSTQGTIVFAPRIGGALQAVSDGGGTPVNVTPVPTNEGQSTDRNPYFLPDGKHFLFVHKGQDAAGKVLISSLNGDQPKEILPIGSNVAYSDGYLFYVKDQTLMAQEFDPASLSFKSKPITVASNLEFYNPRNIAYFSVSQNVLLYRVSSIQKRELVWLDATGKELEHWGDPGPYVGGLYSPVSQTLALYRESLSANGNSIWISDVQRKTINRITPDSESGQTAVVSPDGKYILIATTTGYVSSLTKRELGASGAEEKLLDQLTGGLTLADFSRDGRYAVFQLQDAKTGYDIYYMDLLGEKKLVPFANTRYNERGAKFSPDGKWLSYVSDETGRPEVYITSFPSGGSKWQISNGSTSFSGHWAPDGKSIYYILVDKVFQVEMHPGADKPQFSSPKELLTLPSNILASSIFPDGKRILGARATGDDASVPMNLVLNWQHMVH